MPRVVVTDRLRSYRAAHREVMPSVEHRSHKGPDNRAENPHQPTRQRERAMKGFRSIGGARRFLAAFSGISPHFRPRRHLMTAAPNTAPIITRAALSENITRAPRPAPGSRTTKRNPGPTEPATAPYSHTQNNVTAPAPHKKPHAGPRPPARGKAPPPASGGATAKSSGR
ncbi:hypothetical protein SHIRM173S_04081 [Streptomyces hirsutus]